MNISIFDVVGPVMIGPSSSHTAGAARLARVAAAIVNEPFTEVVFGLHGSFAKTYRGHGTDKALVAGVLGIHADDERLRNAFAIAAEQGLSYRFDEVELEDAHDNSVCISFHLQEGRTRQITGASIGGGQIVIQRIDALEVEVTAQSPTLIITQYDKKGVVSEVTRVLAENDINIGVMRLSRVTKGQIALCVIETDSVLTPQVVAQIARRSNVISAQALNPDM